jgi:hypothetical protein
MKTVLELARSQISLHILVQNRNNQYIIKLQYYYWEDEIEIPQAQLTSQKQKHHHQGCLYGG